jgi:hypothetical protein
MSEGAKKPEPMFPVDVEGAPKVKLAGREWAIVQPAIGQAKFLVPAIMAIGPTFLQIANAAQAAKSTGDTGAMMQSMAVLDEHTFGKITDIVYFAIKRAYPEIGRGEFDAMPITLFELIAAVPTVMQQVGFVKPVEPGNPTAGEVQAGQQQ